AGARGRALCAFSQGARGALPLARDRCAEFPAARGARWRRCGEPAQRPAGQGLRAAAAGGADRDPARAGGDQSMSAFQSRLDTGSESFAANRADMLALVDKLRAIESRAEALSEKRRARFEERGQLTPRERLAHLLDPGMPYLALYNLANYL